MSSARRMGLLKLYAVEATVLEGTKTAVF